MTEPTKEGKPIKKPKAPSAMVAVMDASPSDQIQDITSETPHALALCAARTPGHLARFCDLMEQAMRCPLREWKDSRFRYRQKFARALIEVATTHRGLVAFVTTYNTEKEIFDLQDDLTAVLEMQTKICTYTENGVLRTMSFGPLFLKQTEKRFYSFHWKKGLHLVWAAANVCRMVRDVDRSAGGRAAWTILTDLQALDNPDDPEGVAVLAGMLGQATQRRITLQVSHREDGCLEPIAHTDRAGFLADNLAGLSRKCAEEGKAGGPYNALLAPVWADIANRRWLLIQQWAKEEAGPVGPAPGKTS